MESNITLDEFYDKIAKDSKQALIQLLSEPGHGKSSSLRSIVSKIKEKNPETEFVIFDVSQAWYHNAPVKYRQLITVEKIQRGEIAFIADCVYEMGQLTKDQRKLFVGTFIKKEYDERYDATLNGRLDDYPTLLFIFEEANTYFNSSALKGDEFPAPTLLDYVSVGRNYKMRGLLVATAEVGEISTEVRRRSRRIYGLLESESDLAKIRRKDKEVADYLKEIPKYHFIYYSGKAYGPIRIPDSVSHTPKDYKVDVVNVSPIAVKREPSKWTYRIQGIVGAVIAMVWVLATILFAIYS